MSDELELKLDKAKALSEIMKAAADDAVRDAEREIEARNRQLRLDAARARQWGFSVHRHEEISADRYGIGGGERATMPLAIFTDWAAVVSFMASLDVTIEPDMATAFEVAQYVNTLYRSGESIKLQTHKGYVIYRAPLNQPAHVEPVLTREQRIDQLRRQIAALEIMSNARGQYFAGSSILEMLRAQLSIEKSMGDGE